MGVVGGRKTIYSTFSNASSSQDADLLSIQMEKKMYVIIKQVRRKSLTVRWEDKACPGSISMANGCDVDQGSGSSGERGSIGGKEWSVITPLIRLYTASGYCLPKGW